MSRGASESAEDTRREYSGKTGDDDSKSFSLMLSVNIFKWPVLVREFADLLV